MDERDFWVSMSAKLARIDERTQQIQEEIKGLHELRDRLTAVEQRAKSNTHRLDGIKTTAALLATIASILVNLTAVALKLIFGK